MSTTHAEHTVTWAEPIDPLLSIPELARLFGVAEISVRRLIASGELAHLRIGKQIRVTRTAVDAYLAAGGTPRPATSAPTTATK